MTTSRSGDFRDRVEAAITEAVESVTERLADVKPKLRGWIHAGSTPLIIAANIVLIVLAPDGKPKVGAIVFSLCSVMLFAVSATYHRGNWQPGAHSFLKRWDHVNIFLLIAGTNTPFGLILLDGSNRIVLLCVVWGGALLGVAFQLFWTTGPRWVYVPIYIALGWAAVFFLPQFWDGATDHGLGIGIAIFVLMCAGGALYTIGGVVYGFKRPDPWPGWFGFHEIFHVFTILAFCAHYVGISMAAYQLR